MIELFDDTSEDIAVLYQELQTKYTELEARYNALLKDFEALKQSKSKAGRKPNDEKWTARYQAFAAMKASGCKREEIQEKLNMSRATYFRYNKLYAEGDTAGHKAAAAFDHTADEFAASVAIDTISDTEPAPAAAETASIIDTVSTASEDAPAVAVKAPVLESSQMVDEVLAKANKALSEHTEGLVLDPDTGEYVTPEGLKRRRKLAEIRARRAAEEELNRLAAETAQISEAARAADSSDEEEQP